MFLSSYLRQHLQGPAHQPVRRAAVLAITAAPSRARELAVAEVGELLAHGSLELRWVHAAARGAEGALSGDAREVGLGEVDARVQVLGQQRERRVDLSDPKIG